MKRGIITILLISILLVSPLIQAQEQSQIYSGFDRFVDNVKMAFGTEDNKVVLALEIREKEIDSAIVNSQNGNEKEAIKNLERAHKRLQFVRGKVSLNLVDEVTENVDGIVNKIEDEEDLSDNFDVYVLEEKKTQLTAVLTKEIFEMCKKLAIEDYTLMLQEEKCNPKTAPGPLGEDLKELRKLQEESFTKLMLDIRSCIDDPGTCNCEDVFDVSEKAKCEKMISLAVKCEYKDDQEACDQIIALRPPAESFVPSFLINLFREKSYMIDYDIEKSDVPEECYNENTKPECEQYRHMKETRAKCWDREGNFLEEECGGPEDREPTMQESIPQCYDENDNFLEETCGKITIVKNEEGLINYLIEKEMETIISDFENKSEQYQVDVNESSGQAVWVIEGEIGEVEEDIQDWVVDHPAIDVDSDDGLTWDIKTDVAGDGDGGGGVVVDGDDVVAGNGNGGGGDVGVVVAGDGDGGGDVVAGNGGDGDGTGDDVGGVDDGPGEPGVVDED